MRMQSDDRPFGHGSCLGTRLSVSEFPGGTVGSRLFLTVCQPLGDCSGHNLTIRRWSIQETVIQ
jgi:hypothetical protein